MAVIKDLFVDRGSTYAAHVHILNMNTLTNFNLTGGTLHSSIKHYPEARDIITDFNITVLSYPEGRIILDLTDTQTLLLTHNRYCYDVLYRNGFGQNYKVVQGLIIVSYGATDA